MYGLVFKGEIDLGFIHRSCHKDKDEDDDDDDDH